MEQALAELMLRLKPADINGTVVSPQGRRNPRGI
jgi:hypothetical protein